MATKANATITLFDVVDIDSTTWYYLLQSSTASPPPKPTTATPSSDWKTTEPAYTEGSTNTLYTVMKTTYSDETFEYSDVSKSSSYEAAKAAYNKAIAAAKTATNYMQYADGVGLVVGDMTASTLGNNVLIDSDSVDIRNGDKLFSSFHGNGMDVYANGNKILSVEKTDAGLDDYYWSTIRSNNNDLYIESTEYLNIKGRNGITINSGEGPLRLSCFGDQTSSDENLLIEANTKISGKLRIGNDAGYYYALVTDIDCLDYPNNIFCTDFVVEHGTKGIWTYRKWASGVVECWGGQSYSSMAVNTAYGNLYYHQSNPVPLPFAFAKLTDIQATVYATTGGLFGVSVKSGTSTSQIAYYITSAKAEARANLIVELHVSGRWK